MKIKFDTETTEREWSFQEIRKSRLMYQGEGVFNASLLSTIAGAVS
jgi:hypothetical protein